MSLGNDASDDTSLALRAADGDQVAFGKLMRRHKEPLYRFIRRLTGDAEEAYDLLQETFLVLWKSLSRYDAQWSFEAWARRIALNKARDWRRRRAVRRLIAVVLPGGGASDPLVPDDTPSPETLAGDRQMVQQLDAAIARLPNALKEPLVLAVIDGLSQREVAKVLGISEKAVETRIRRARRRLDDILQR